MTLHTETARAKVNLTLGVRGRRPDGYHELESLVAFAGFGDVLTLDASSGPQRGGVTVTGPFAPTLAGHNLVAVAMARAAECAPGLVTGAVTLDKRLPVAAGLGGGSADAAAVLRLIRRVNADATLDWLAIAARLGADVPVCFENRAAFITGTGERIAPCAALPALAAVLVNPLVRVPTDKTAQVFRRLGARPLPADFERPEPPGAFASADQLVAYMAAHGNDLDRPAREIVPVIAEVTAALEASEGCRLARMSGGGPTCFGVFDTDDDARAAAHAIHLRHPGWWTVATTLS